MFWNHDAWWFLLATPLDMRCSCSNPSTSAARALRSNGSGVWRAGLLARGGGVSSPELSAGLGGTYAFLLALGLALGGGGSLVLFFTPGGRPLFLGAGTSTS
jgi:hypothetical protein